MTYEDTWTAIEVYTPEPCVSISGCSKHHGNQCSKHHDNQCSMDHDCQCSEDHVNCRILHQLHVLPEIHCVPNHIVGRKEEP